MIGVPFPSWRKDWLANSLGTKPISLSGWPSTCWYPTGLHIITKLRNKMHNRLLDMSDKLLLRKRASIETIHDQLKKNICQIEHSRHRSPINFLANLVTGLIAYCHQPKKPSLGL
jgi:Transposase DDE domain